MVKSAKTDHTNQPIGVQEISDLFTDSVFKKPDLRKAGKPVNLAPQLCILYYILLYEETLESQRKNLGKTLICKRMKKSSPDCTSVVNYL